MSHPTPPRSRRSSRAPNLPQNLSKALSAVRNAPAEDANWEHLEEVCRELDRPEEGAALFLEVMDSTDDVALRIKVGLRAADFCEEWFEETEPVVDVLSRVLQVCPNHQDAFERLTVLLTVSSRWSELLAAYDAALGATETTTEKAQLLEEAAKVARDFAGNSQLGSDYLKELLLLRPEDDHLAAILEKRLDEQARHKDLVDVWRARLSVVEPAQARATRLSIAARQLDALREADAALATIDEYLSSGGAPEEALQLLARTAESQQADKMVRRAALGKLARIEQDAGNWPRVVLAIEQELALIADEAEAASLHRRAATILRNIERPEEALAHGAAVLRISPGDDEMRVVSRELSLTVGKVSDYVDALVAAAHRADQEDQGEAGGPLRVDLLLEAAELSDATLGHIARAIELYARLADDPAAEQPALLHACRRLCALLEAEGEREHLLVYLVRWADLEANAQERSLVLGRAALLADALGQVEQSLGLWNARLADDEADLEALACKIDLLRRSGRPAGLVEALEARASVSPDAEQCRNDLVLAASLYDEQLGDIAQAIERWQQIEQRFGRTDQTVDHLVDLLRRAGRHEEVSQVLGESVEILETLVSTEPEGERVSRLVGQLSLLGETLRNFLDQPGSAIEAYARALRQLPTDETSRAGLRALLEDEALAHAASEQLVQALRAAGDGRAIVELAEVRLRAAPNAGFRAEVLREVARLEEQSGDSLAATQAARRAFALVASEETEHELLRLAQLSGAFSVAADAYVEAAAHCEGDARLFTLHRAHGQVAEQHLQDLARATAAFAQAVRKRAGDLETAKALARVGLGARLFREAADALILHALSAGQLDPELGEYFRERAELTGTWEEVLAGLADGIASQTELPAELLHDLKKQLAVWYRDCAHDADSAEMVLRRAVADLPKEQSLRMLADLQRRAPGRPLIDTLLTLADVTSGELSALKEAGEVALARGEDVAQSILQRALAIASERFRATHPDGRAPEDFETSEAESVASWAIDGLVRLAQEAGDVEAALELLARAVELPFTGEALVARRFQAADVAAQGGLDGRAVGLGEALLQDVPDHGPTIGLLSRLHELAGRLEQLLELRRRELSLEPPVERQLFLRLDQARVMGELGASENERLALLRDNLDQQPGHEASIEAMDAVLRGAERFDEAADLLETQAAVVLRTDRVRASKMWLRAGKIAEERLLDLARLESDYRSAVKAEPHAGALDRLAELAHSAGNPAVEVGWLEQRLALAPSAAEGPDAQEERRDVVRRYGAALVAAEEFAHARQLLESELRKDPGADASRRILIELYSSFEEWAPLSELLSTGVSYAPSIDDKIDYLRRAALVERRKLGQVARAVELFEGALALSPKDRELRLLLADCLLEAGGLERARELLTSLLEEFGRRRTKERASVHKLLARIARAEGQLDVALAQAEEAAKIERMDPGILMLLAELARERGEISRAEQAYRTLALVVSRHKPSETEEEEAFGEAAILFELYQIALSRGQDEQARELLSSALEVAMRSSQEALQLEKSLRLVGKADLLLGAIDQQLEAAEGAAAASLLVTRAVILEKNGDLEAALGARLAALRLSPKNGRVIEGARLLAEKMGQLQSWLSCLVDLAESHADNAEVAGDLWYRLGRAAEANDDLHAAADLFERAQATGYRPRRAFLALDSVLGRLGDRSRTQAALSRFVGTSGSGERGETLADALYRLAEFELGDGRVEQGAEHLLAATSMRADDLRTLDLVKPTIQAQIATPGLVKLFLDVASTAGEAETRLLAYIEAAKLDDASEDVLTAGIELARQLEAGAELRTLLSRRVELAERDGRLADARSEILERADLAEVDRDIPLLVSLLEKVAPSLVGEEALAQRLRMAALLVHELGDLSRARPIYESLLEAEPGERRIWQPLLALYRRQGDSEAVELCILMVEPEVSDREDREVLRMARIRLMVEAGRLEEAEQALRATLQEEPDSEEAAQVLAELLRKAERFEELRSLLLELFDKARDRQDARQVSAYGLELARAFGDRPEEAAAILTSGLNLAHDDEAYLKTLLALQGPSANPDDRGSVLGHLIELAPPPEAEQYTWDLIALRENQGDDIGLGRALELGQAAVPGSVSLSDRLVEYLRAHEDYSALAEHLLKRAGAQRNADRAVQEYAEAALLFERTLGEPARAAEAMLAAFERRPDELLYLRQGADYLVRAGEVELALTKLGELIDAGDELVLADLLDQRARILETERSDDLGALEQAAADLRIALEQLLPEEQEADIQRRRGQVLETLRSAYAEQQEAEREREVVLELAALRADRREFDSSVATLASWVESHPDDLEVAERLGEVAIRGGDAHAALLAYQSIFDGASGEAKRSAALALARLAERVGDPLRARGPLEEVFREFPSDAEVRHRLRANYEAAGAFRELADLLMGEAATLEDPEARFGLLVEIGDLFLQSGDGESACDMFESARQMRPDSYLIVAKLAQAYVDLGEVDRAEAALDAALEHHGKRRTPDLALLQHGLAVVAEARGDVDGMFAWLEAALMSDRANGHIATELAVRAHDGGRYDVAVKALQVIALSKGNEGMSKAEAYYRQARIAEEQGDPKKALMLARRAATADADFGPAQDLVNQLS